MSYERNGIANALLHLDTAPQGALDRAYLRDQAEAMLEYLDSCVITPTKAWHEILASRKARLESK